MNTYNKTCHIQKNTFGGYCEYDSDQDHIEIVAGSSEDLKDYYSNDWHVEHFGDYKNFDEARAAVTELFGEVRTDDEQNVAQSMDDNVLLTCKPGLLINISCVESFDFVYDFMTKEITHETTDEELFELNKNCHIDATDLGCKLAGDVEDWMTKHRDDLIQDQKECIDDE